MMDAVLKERALEFVRLAADHRVENQCHEKYDAN